MSIMIIYYQIPVNTAREKGYCKSNMEELETKIDNIFN